MMVTSCHLAHAQSSKVIDILAESNRGRIASPVDRRGTASSSCGFSNSPCAAWRCTPRRAARDWRSRC